MSLNAKKYCNSKMGSIYILYHTNWYGINNKPTRCLAILYVDEEKKEIEKIALLWENYREENDEYFPDFYWGDYYFPEQIKPTEIKERLERKIKMQDETMTNWKIVEYKPIDEMVKNFVSAIFS